MINKKLTIIGSLLLVVIATMIVGINKAKDSTLSGEPLLGGITRTIIGVQTAWETSLVPSGSFVVNLGSTSKFVNKIFSTTASHSNGEFTVAASASAFKGSAFPSSSCNGTTFLQWATTGIFGCGTPAGGGGASPLQVRIANPIGTDINPAATISFDANNFDITASGSVDARVKIDYVNGPASRSIAQTWAKLQTFTLGASFSAGVEFSSVASASSFNSSNSGASNSFAGSLNISKGITGLSFQGGGLTTCSASGKVLRYLGGLFSCGTLGTGDIDYSAIFQPLDSTLTALAGLDSTTGFLGESAGDTFVRRTLTGTTNQIAITNADSTVGNPVWSITNPFIVPGRASISTNFEVLGWSSISQFENVGGFSRLSNSIAQFASNSNNFAQVNIQNFSSGASASGDLTITANDGTNTSRYINLGINSSKFSFLAKESLTAAHDAYLIASVSNFDIFVASTSSTAAINFGVGGTPVTGNKRFSIMSVGSTLTVPFEVTGAYASVSALKGSAFPTSNCTGQTALQWSTTGLFTCSGSFQTQATSLTNLAALGGNGFVGQTGANTFANRTLTGTTNQIGVTNGDSTVGNPVFSITSPFIAPGSASVSSNFEILGTGSVSGAFTQISGAASNQFGGSLKTLKGFTANSYQGGGLGACGDATHALSYSGGQFGCQVLSGGTGIAANAGVAAQQVLFFKDAGTTASGSKNFLKDVSGRLILGTTAQQGSSILTIASASARFSILPLTNTGSASIDFYGNGVTANNQSKFTLEAGGLAGTSSESFYILTGNGTKALTITSTSFIGIDEVFGGKVDTALEVGGTASASAFKGGAFPTSNCTGQTALQWTFSTGIFSCSGSFQTQDATLTALAALDATTGFLGETGADTFVRRTLTGTTNQIAITNGDSQTGNPVWSITSPFIVPQNASITSNFEVLGTTSVSGAFTQHTAATSNSFAGSLTVTKGVTAGSYQSGGLGACTGLSFLQYSGGQFSCAAAPGGSAPITVHDTKNSTRLKNQASLSFEFNSFTITASGTKDALIKLNWGTSGVASRSATNTWSAWNSFTGGASVSGGSGFEVLGVASVSGKFTQGSVASNSFLGSLTGATTGTLSVGTGNNPLKQLISNIIQAVVTFFFPTYTGTTLTGTGNSAIQTGSASFDFNDGSVTKVVDGRTCFTYVVDSPTTANPSFVGPKRFDNPFTITSVQSVASGSNAAGWNLVYGVPGTLTTSVFTLNKSASTSTYPTYTTFANSALTDGQALAVKITSRSAVLQTFSVSVCGRYNH